MSVVDDAGTSVTQTAAAFRAARQAIVDAQVGLANAKTNFAVRRDAYEAAIAVMLTLVHGSDDQSDPTGVVITRKPI